MGGAGDARTAWYGAVLCSSVLSVNLWVDSVRIARDSEMRVSCEMGVSRSVGRLGEAEVRSGESAGRREIAERISGVVVRRTIGLGLEGRCDGVGTTS